jgi:GPH family glycoside/pentoside/hexuronide:cation symporter
VPEQANYFVLLAEGSAIVFIPVWVWVARKLDKRRAYMIGSLIWVVILLILSTIRADQVGLAYLLAALSGSGIATAYVLPWSMVPDIIELDQAKTGERREGTYYSFASFFQKLATGIAVWGMGQALAMTGYQTPTLGAPLPVQPEAAVNAIRIFAGPIPALLLILSLPFAWKYNVTRESHQALVEQLANRD